jgi:ATP-dependent DNA helicase DinG
VSTVRRKIEQAFKRLEERPGYVLRPDQLHLALLLSDLIEGETTGAFEAPTGLGKSLASLIPAIAHGVVNKTRVVISTYTNVLAEQYWTRDLPLALSLFDEEDRLGFKSQFLIGRQRYACLISLNEAGREMYEQFTSMADQGTESEFSQIFRKGAFRMWQTVATPPVCPGRQCPQYDACYYYRARRQAERATLVITNHSVVIQDAVLAKTSTDDKGLLGDFDFLLIDEAHDLYTAAAGGLEFEMSDSKLNMVSGIVTKLEETLLPAAGPMGDGHAWVKGCEQLRQKLEFLKTELNTYSLHADRPGIVMASPAEVWDHPAVKARHSEGGADTSRRIANDASSHIDTFLNGTHRLIAKWSEEGGVKESLDTAHNYLMYLSSYSQGCKYLFEPTGVAVSYIGLNGQNSQLKQDLIDLAAPLDDLLWQRRPWACLSATLALDGTFDHFKRVTGAAPKFEEILPSPFDFATQAAVYVPKLNSIPDPSIARKQGIEDAYHRAVATELSKIIRALEGRTLALFHSRKEMEAVRMYMDLPDDLSILMQTRSGAGAVGQKFITNIQSSLFALRSFWTGFDAPGETLSCVALVRVPFEVPIDPTPIARMAWLQSQGQDPFATHTLPAAKMMMRQGAGRLIRRAEDRGIIALLDPRLKTKRYGEEILANLPSEMRHFEDIDEAVGWVGLGSLIEFTPPVAAMHLAREEEGSDRSTHAASNSSG